MQKAKKTQNWKYSVRTKDLPATQGILHLVRNELKADNRVLRAEMKSGFKQVDARFKQVDARFNEVDARFNEVDARFNRMDARFDRMDAKLNEMGAKFHGMDAKIHGLSAKLEEVLSQVYRIATVVEEQNTRNQTVLEGLTNLYQRQDRVETEVEEIRNVVHGLAARSPR